jgi:acyl carrier protein
MDKAAIHTQLEGVFRQFFRDPQLTLYDAMTASDVDDWTSANHVELLATIEESFGIKFKLKEINNSKNLRNVGEFIALLAQKLNSPTG